MRRLALVLPFLILVACGGGKASQTETKPAAVELSEPAETAAAESAPSDAPDEVAETAPEDVLPNDGSRQVGDVTKCPVSGEVFTVSAETPSAEHDGGTYYFCCPNCVAKFEADPAAVLAKTPAEGHKHKHEHGEHHH